MNIYIYKYIHLGSFLTVSLNIGELSLLVSDNGGFPISVFFVNGGYS